MSQKFIELKSPLRLSSDAGLVLHQSRTEPGRFQISQVGTEENPTLSNAELLRLAIEVLRSEATERLIAYTAVRQLRYRSADALKRKLLARLRQIEEHFGGCLPLEQRQTLLLRRQLLIGERLQLEQIDERWRLVDLNSESRSKPHYSWRELVTLSVLVLRDMWTEIFHRSFYLPMLRTPDEVEAFDTTGAPSPEPENAVVAKSENATEIAIAATECMPCATQQPELCIAPQDELQQQRIALASERSELDQLLEDIIKREQMVEARAQEVCRQRAALSAREQHISSVEERLGVSAQSTVVNPAPRVNAQAPKQQKRKRRRRRRSR